MGGGEETKSRKFIRALEHNENRKIHLCDVNGLKSVNVKSSKSVQMNINRVLNKF